MALPASLPNVSISEFFDWEEKADGRFELVQGQIVAMAGASANHAGVSAALSGMCRSALAGRDCRFLGQDAKVIVAGSSSAYHPDGLIACPPNYVDRRAGALDNPTVIFEVLSPSTQDLERNEKFDDYARLPILRDYVLIGSERARVEVFSRRDDGVRELRVFIEGSTAHVASVGLELALDELYANAFFEPRPDTTANGR